MEAEDRFRGLEARIAAVEQSNAVSAVIGGNIENRLHSIEDTLRWLVRLIIGALLMAVVAFMIKGGFSV